MERTGAYSDYLARFEQVSALLRAAIASTDPVLAGAASKGAIVLAAAAVERFMNDAVRQACQRIRVTEYAALSEGQQAYLCAQIAKRISSFLDTDGDYRRFRLDRRDSLKKAIEECHFAFEDPSLWPHIADFGLFMDGAAAPGKIAAVLRDFDATGQDVFAELEHRNPGRGIVLGSLVQLIDARHDAAHALSHGVPSPSDARSWIVCSVVVVRLVESFLVTVSPLPTREQ